MLEIVLGALVVIGVFVFWCDVTDSWNNNPPHFFCDRNASSFSTAPEKSVHAQTSAFGAGLS
jgi:hypothetical protein